MELNGLSKNNSFGETWFPKTKQLLFRLLDPSIHFFQGFSEDLPTTLPAYAYMPIRIISWICSGLPATCFSLGACRGESHKIPTSLPAILSLLALAAALASRHQNLSYQYSMPWYAMLPKQLPRSKYSNIPTYFAPVCIWKNGPAKMHQGSDPLCTVIAGSNLRWSSNLDIGPGGSSLSHASTCILRESSHVPEKTKAKNGARLKNGYKKSSIK